MADANQTYINNVAYSWSMIMLQTSWSTDNTDSPIFVDATSIKWNSSRKVDSIYGLGGQPRKRGFGNVTYEASITIPYGTQIALRAMSPNGTLLGLGEFDLTVSWVNDLSENISSESVTLAGCIFTDSGMDANQDDTSLTKDFDLHPHRIYTNDVLAKKSTWSFEMYSGD